MIHHDRQDRPYDELLVVCGPPRSGTTWLQRELCSAPGAFRFLPECSLVTQQVGLYHRTAHNCDSQRFAAYFGDQEFLRAFCRDNIARLIDRAALLNQSENARTLILKDPCLCLYLEDLGEVLPPHRLIVLVRNPLDVIASMKAVTGRRKEKWRINSVASELLQYYLQINRHAARPDSGCLFLRYEDVVTGNRHALSGILEGIGLADHIVIDTAAVAAKLDASDPFFSEHYLRATTSERIGAYRKTLSLFEIVLIETMYADIMLDWNYEDPPDSASWRIARSLASSLKAALRYCRRRVDKVRHRKGGRD
ncbi:MAG: sulfotransferase [Rhodocyclaceae bacterium]|nr:sulfotransferase [Rhodocyclaceae bacterium]MCO5097815.1 sulfotransferase [Rhodocyclaceae bacterium]